VFAIDTNASLSGDIRVDESPIYEHDSTDYSKGLIVHGVGEFAGWTTFNGINANGNVIVDVARMRYNTSAKPGVGDDQCFMLVDDGSGPYSVGDLYVVVQINGTEKTIQITDFSAGTTA